MAICDHLTRDGKGEEMREEKGEEKERRRQRKIRNRVNKGDEQGQGREI